MELSTAYIVAARRTALGRTGGLHGRRKIDELAAPVVRAVLADAKLDAAAVEGLVLGNATEAANPARLIALNSGLAETADAITIDRQCASGLDAIVQACRTVGSGEAEILLAGGAEAISTAPWRVAKPRALHQLPRFIGMDRMPLEGGYDSQAFEAPEALARAAGISRAEQDAIALRSHLAALSARDARAFVGEIVPLRSTAEEARDELVRDLSPEDLADQGAYSGDEGLLTPGNTSAQADGAALVAVTSARVWKELGQPPALRLATSARNGVSPEAVMTAPVAATQRLIGLNNTLDVARLDAIEISENSAAQLIYFARQFGVDEGVINAGGGAIARGHPFAAAGAVLVVRLFTRLLRQAASKGAAGAGRRGLATLGAVGGLGTAALFETV